MDGDLLLTPLGARAGDPAVQETLRTLAGGSQPELDPEDDENHVD